MRVLLVNAYPVGNKRGLERFDKFRQHVLCVVKELEKTEVTDVELVVRCVALFMRSVRLSTLTTNVSLPDLLSVCL